MFWPCERAGPPWRAWQATQPPRGHSVGAPGETGHFCLKFHGNVCLAEPAVRVRSQAGGATRGGLCVLGRSLSLSYREILACPWRAGVPQEQPSPLEGIGTPAENQRGRGVPLFPASAMVLRDGGENARRPFPQCWDTWYWLAPELASTRDASVTCFTKPLDTVAYTTESQRRGVIGP